MWPVSSLPAARRVSGDSMPWTTALRSMCSNGGSMRSSTCRSNSPDAPSTSSSARLPVSAAAWRTMRARRCTWRWNETMRVRISPFCSSVTVRDCCCSRFCASPIRFSSSPWMLADVAGGFGQRARELLDRRVAIQFQRIELRAVTRLGLVPVQNLRLGLHLELAQLLLQSRDRARQLPEIEFDRTELLLQPCARDAHLAGAVEQLVEQLGADTRHLDPVGSHDRLASGGRGAGGAGAAAAAGSAAAAACGSAVRGSMAGVASASSWTTAGVAAVAGVAGATGATGAAASRPRPRPRPGPG